MSKLISLRVPLAALCAANFCQASAERCNLAKFQSVTASGNSSTYVADFAVDGVVSNFHSYRTNNTNNPHWIEVRFPRVVEIGSAHLYLGLDNDPAQGGLPTFKLQYHDGTAWADIPGASVTGNTDAERPVIFTAAVTSDRFRLHSDENGSRVIREMALFPPNLSGGVEQGFPIGTDVNLSLTHMRPAEGTTIHAGAFPKRAVDGYVDDSSRWVSSNLADQSIVIDLLIPHAIGSAHLYSGFGQTAALSDFKLQSWDGINWLDIPGATLNGNTGNSLAIPFSSDVITSRVRLLNTSTSFTRVKELLLFPPRAGGYPLGQDVKLAPPPICDWAEFEENSYELRNDVADVRLLGYHDEGVRYATNAQTRSALGWQLLANHRDGGHRIRHLASGKCLALSAISTVSNNPVILEDYTGMPHQDWFLQKTNTTRFRIINLHSGLALQVGAGDAMVVAPVNPSSDLQLWFTQSPVQALKKGIAASAALFPNTNESWIASSWPLFNAATTTSWAYTWGRQTAETFPFIGPQQTFHPMQWSGNMVHGLSFPPIESLRRELNGSPKPVHVMGFNEPDKTEQGNVTVDNAIALWPRLEALGRPLVAPAPANMFGGWFEDFKAKADARGLRYDYTPVHWYSAPNLTNAINHLENVYNNYGRPVWLTEFAPISWSGSGNWTKRDNYNFLAEFMWHAESLPWLKRYSLFQFEVGRESGTDGPNAPRGNSRNADGSLTAFGELYAGWDGVASVVNNRPYHLQNRGVYRRVRNPGVTTPPDLVATSDTEIPSTGTQWHLIPGTTGNTVRIVSTLDGRRLRYFTGTTVGLVAATNFTGQSEWRLVPDQYGWYFLEHPQSNTRLQMDSSGTLLHGSISGSTDAFKWRFVAPAATENTAPVLASIPPQAVDEGTLLTFTASATDGDVPANTLTYSLIGAPIGAVIDPGTGTFTWTPSEVDGPGVFNFSVRVSDGSLVHDQAVTITVNETNVAPVLAPIASQTVNQGALSTFTASATDADLPANTLTHSLIGAPAGASIDSVTGAFAWIPAGNQGPGTFNFSVRVNDGSLVHDQPVSITVNDVNLPPVLDEIPAKTASEGSSLAFTANATDADMPPDTLAYSLIGAPDGASINPTTGFFEWTPSEDQGPGVYNPIIRVTDGFLTHDRQVTITVDEVNSAPVLAEIPPQTVTEGSPLTFTASATDSDLPANTLSYSLLGAPLGASISPTTGIFTWTPDQTQGPGTFNFTIRANDGSLDHYQGAVVTVFEDGGSDVLDTWIISGQSNAEGYGITQNPVAGLTPSATLATVGRGDLNVIHNNVGLFQGATDLSGSITASAGLSLPPRDAWHAMTSYEGLAYDWGSGRGNESGRRFGPELAFGFDVQAMLGSPIALIKYARGNSSIAPTTAQSGGVWRDFDPDDGGRLNQYDKLVSTIQGALDNLPPGQVLNIRGVLWMQGDGDAASSASASAYQSNLTDFIASLRADIGDIAASGGGRMTRSAPSWSQLDVFVGTILNSNGNANRQTVINAQNAVAAADPNVFAVNGTTGLSSLSVDDWGGSGIHYDTAGQVMLGERFADAAISRIDSGVLVSESGGSTSVTEGGTTDSYTVTLTRAPSADVIIGISTDSQVTVSPALLTFTTGNWNTPQTVTVTAVNDTVNESNHSGAISHDLTSADLSFGGLPIAGVTAAIIDNDDTPLPSSEADADQDGLSDLLEYAFATDPGIPNGNPFRAVGSGAGSVTLEFPWNWQASGINWRIRHGQDLSNIAAWPVVAPGTTTIIREGNLDRITVTPAKADPDRGFYVLEVFGN